ncbi:MAG: GFA family protein, partial [Acidiferrobacterales bacterium]
CSDCGSHIYAYMAAKPDIVVLRMGTLDEDPKVRPIRHIWMSHRAPWYEVLDDLPTHDEMPA